MKKLLNYILLALVLALLIQQHNILLGTEASLPTKEEPAPKISKRKKSHLQSELIGLILDQVRSAKQRFITYSKSHNYEELLNAILDATDSSLKADDEACEYCFHFFSLKRYCFKLIDKSIEVEHFASSRDLIFADLNKAFYQFEMPKSVSIALFCILLKDVIHELHREIKRLIKKGSHKAHSFAQYSQEICTIFEQYRTLHQ